MDALTDFVALGGRGILLGVDPEDADEGTLADVLNVEVLAVVGSVTPRPGSRILPAYDSVPLGGHPASPLGNASFDGSAQVLRLISDQLNSRLWAIVTTGVTDRVSVYYAALGSDAPGFTLAAASLTVKTDRIPGAALYDGRLYIPAGTSDSFLLHVVTTTGAVTQSGTSPAAPVFQPYHGMRDALDAEFARTDMDHATANARPTAANGYMYAYAYVSSGGGFRTALSLLSYRRVGQATGAAPPNDLLPGDALPGTGKLTTKTWIRTYLRTPPLDMIAAGYDRIEVYRTTDGGNVLRLLETINYATYNAGYPIGNQGVLPLLVPTDPPRTTEVNFIYADRTLDDELSFTEAPRNVGRIPTARLAMPHLDRMIYANLRGPVPEPSLAVYSEVNYPTLTDPFNRLAIHNKDGDEVEALRKLYDRAFAYKNYSLFEIIDGRPTTPFIVVPVSNEGAIGACNGETVVEIKGRHFFMSWQGVGVFDGQQPGLVPGIEALFAENQLENPAAQGGPQPLQEPDRGFVALNFRSPLNAAATFQFQVKFFDVESDDPNAGAVQDDAIDGTGLGGAQQLRCNGEQMSASGVALGAGGRATLLAYPSLLAAGSKWYPWLRYTTDGGTTWSSWTARPAFVHRLSAGMPLGLNWALVKKFFAINYWPRNEYWLYVASRGSARIDTKLVLDTDSVNSETGPIWRRETVHATAAALVRELRIDANNRNMTLPVMGDSNGCVFVERWPGGIDRDASRATPLTWLQRVGSGTLDGASAVLTPPVSLVWPTSTGGLKGQAITVRDSAGQTYSGIITANAATNLTVGFWLENRTPPASATVEFAIGGIDARIETHMMALGDGNQVKQIAALKLRGAGAAEPVDIELRTAAQADPSGEGMALRLKRKILRGVLIGGNVDRLVPAKLRGRFVGLRIGTHEPGRRWVASAWGVKGEPTASEK